MRFDSFISPKHVQNLPACFVLIIPWILILQEADDNDFESEDSESDNVDSDFSIDENDELKSDDEDGHRPKRKRTGVVTKAYKVR